MQPPTEVRLENLKHEANFYFWRGGGRRLVGAPRGVVGGDSGRGLGVYGGGARSEFTLKPPASARFMFFTMWSCPVVSVCSAWLWIGRAGHHQDTDALEHRGPPRCLGFSLQIIGVYHSAVPTCTTDDI